jgi:hypothetical protein
MLPGSAMLKVDNRPFPNFLNSAVGLLVSTSGNFVGLSRFSLSSLILLFSVRSYLLAGGSSYRINWLVPLSQNAGVGSPFWLLLLVAKMIGRVVA